MKKTGILALSIVFGLLISITASAMNFSKDCDNLRQNLLRLHIIANSDSAEDQAAKLAVRDRLQTEFAGLFSMAENEQQAETVAAVNLDKLKFTAEDELRKHGSSDDVAIQIIDRYFLTTEYENFVLPAGQYRALQVRIGKAEGKNWWCVAFPPLCLPAATAKDVDKAVILTPKQQETMKKSGGYKIKFKIVEIYQNIKKWMSE
jgi:stage II sporulation protein R